MQGHNRQPQYDPKDALASIRAQARYLASTLSRLGRDQTAIEKELYSSGFHPSICYETLNWIQSEAFAENHQVEAPNRQLS